MEELYGTRYQSGFFSLIIVGSGFHCLRSFSFFDMLGGRSDYLCERLCCMVVVASDLRACGAFVWLTFLEVIR